METWVCAGQQWRHLCVCWARTDQQWGHGVRFCCFKHSESTQLGERVPDANLRDDSGLLAFGPNPVVALFPGFVWGKTPRWDYSKNNNEAWESRCVGALLFSYKTVLPRRFH